MYKPKVVKYTMYFERKHAPDGETDTRDIQTNYTSRTDMFKFKLQQMKEALMDLLDEYDFDIIIADALVLCAVLLAFVFVFGIYFFLEPGRRPHPSIRRSSSRHQGICRTQGKERIQEQLRRARTVRAASHWRRQMKDETILKYVTFAGIFVMFYLLMSLAAIAEG